MNARAAAIAGILLVGLVGGLVLFVGLPRWYGPRPEASAALPAPAGSLDEILTVYTIVNALTVNLPAITRVQILIDGKEVDTLAGHVDLRHPLAKSLEWVAHDTQ